MVGSGWRRISLWLLVLLCSLFVTARPVRAQEVPPVFLPFLSAPTVPPTQLPGNPSAPATASIPDLRFVARPQDYNTNHPELGGIEVSFNTLYVVFTLGTTVGEANAILRDLNATIVGGIPGQAGQLEGVLVLRLPTTTHTGMSTALQTLRANPHVAVAVQDSLIETLEPQPESASGRSVPAPNGGTPPGWTWDLSPAGDNWGLELIRVPQTWNFNDAVRKAGGSAVTGVLDTGFVVGHLDLSYEQNLSPSALGDHGSHVSGIIGARFNNFLGTDGVNPFARLVVKAHTNGFAWGLLDFLAERGDMQVVNISLGNNWYLRTTVSPNINSEIQTLITDQARVLVYVLDLYRSNVGALPLLVVAAGNDSGPKDLDGDGTIDVNLGVVEARWSSPYTYASLVLGDPDILVVESVRQRSGSLGGATRALSSNVVQPGAKAAAVSAPGVAIMSTAFTAPYMLMSGTSMATPHVTGLAGYLLSLEPTLTHSELRQLLLGNAVAVAGGASARVDAFASALAIDTLSGNSAILKKLVDVDDGTLDGNSRVLCTGCADYVNQDADGDGGIGDGSVDMSDFRRWRDWLLQAEADPSLKLDGSVGHPKKDLNGDGLVQSALQENVYPRGDFNGDGIIDRTQPSFVPGAINAQATDLDVLSKLFADADYKASNLPNLIDSADLEVDAQECLTLPGVAQVQSQLFVSGTTTPIQSRIHKPDQRIHIYTAAVNPIGYTLKVTAQDSSGKAVGIALRDFPFDLGSDAFYTPVCGRIELDPPKIERSLNLSETVDVNVRLISHNLAATYTVSNTVPHVNTAPDQGALAKDGEVTLVVSLNCTDEAGLFSADPALVFHDEDGHLLDAAVPPAIDIELKCLPGGVTAIPEPVQVTAAVEQSVDGLFALFNQGTALTYQVTAAEMVSPTANAAGILPETGAVTVTLQATCPSAAGIYTQTLGLTFAREDGEPVTVDKPDGVDVVLTCEDNRAVVIVSSIHSAAAILEYPQFRRSTTYESEYVEKGKASLQTYELRDGQSTTTKTEIPLLGWYGDLHPSAAVEGTFVYTTPVGGVIDTRSVAATATQFAGSGYAYPTATFTGTIVSTYDESNRFTHCCLISPAEGTSGQTIVVFDLKEAATVEATWTCSGWEATSSSDLTIRLFRIQPEPTVVFQTGSPGSGCDYKGPMAPGRYEFRVASGITYLYEFVNWGRYEHSASKAVEYTMTITIDP